MNSPIRGFLTSFRVQAQIQGNLTAVGVQVSDTLKPHERPFTGMLDRHPSSASGRGECSLLAFPRRSSFPCRGASERQWHPYR